MQAYDFYKQVFHLEDEDLIQELVQISQIRHLGKREILVREGEIQKEIGFLISGCIYGFTQNSKGEEVVSCFTCRLGESTMAAFALDEPSNITTMTLMDTEILCIPLEVAMHYIQTNITCLQLYNRMLQQSLRQFATMQITIYRGSAMERYRWFLKEYPGLIDNINNKYIASFLQMTNVTLSRLRRIDREQQSAAAAASEG